MIAATATATATVTATVTAAAATVGGAWPGCRRPAPGAHCWMSAAAHERACGSRPGDPELRCRELQVRRSQLLLLRRLVQAQLGSRAVAGAAPGHPVDGRRR